MHKNNILKKKIILLTNSNSIKGRAILKSIKNSNIEIEKVISIKTNYLYYLKLFKFVSRRVGLIQALIFSAIKLMSDCIHELFFCDLKSLNLLIKEFSNVPIVDIEYNNWQKLANRAIENCNTNIVVIGQVGILGKEFSLNSNEKIILNSHPGKLPQYRGIDSFKWATFAKDWGNHAITIHIVRDKIDGGEILKIVNYDWQKFNWFFVDRELLIMSGKTLIRYLDELNNEKLLENILGDAIIQEDNFSLNYKMGIFKEIKTYLIYFFNKHFN